MGHYGKSISASDSYEDFTADLYGFFGYVNLDDDDDNSVESYENYQNFLTKEMFDSKTDELKDWFNTNHGLATELQFLGYHLLRLGVNITEASIDSLIDAFETDKWAEQDLERKIYMSKAVEALKNYKTDKTPVDIDFYYGDFEHYFINKIKDKTNEIPTPSELVKLIEDNVGIKVKQILTNDYSLTFMVGDEDFKKVDSSLFGIKFVKKYRE